jgi:protoporphyrinogen oxidase
MTTANTAAEYLILGAGPTGLGAAHRLQELGQTNYLVLDQAHQVGGLAFSWRDQAGFWWDFGGHVLFSHYRYFDEMYDRLMVGEFLTHQRQASIVMAQDSWVPYPFQNNLQSLATPDQQWMALRGLYQQARQSFSADTLPPRNFHEWIVRSYGEGIAEQFLFPYNQKVWAISPDKMNTQWVGERVAPVDFLTSLHNVILKTTDQTWGPNQTFRFPQQGGNGELWRRVARQFPSHLRLHDAVTRVDLDNKLVFTAQGVVYRYEHLFNTLPLDSLLSLSQTKVAATRQWLDASTNLFPLFHSSVHVIGIGLRQPIPPALIGQAWFYFPQPDVPFYRVTVYSNYSPHNVPSSDFWSLMCEVSDSPYHPVDQVNLERDTVNALKKLGFIASANQVTHITQTQRQHAYPTPTLDRDASLLSIHPWLAPYQIASRGRFGGWKYEVGNQDHCFMQGVEWVNHTLFGTPELTYYAPGWVNDALFRQIP